MTIERRTARALLVYPRNPVAFWNFDEALAMIDKRSAFPPLGLLTIAGMMPDRFELRLRDLNVTQLEDRDLDWADIVLTSSMIIHWKSLEEVIARCNARDVPVLNGGPLPTQYHEEIDGDAVFYLGEAENGFLDVVDRMLASPEPTTREYVDRRGRFQTLEETPVPRWDLIDFAQYSTLLIQITRGCPESCTFCNIPSLYGKTTRLKSGSRVAAELDAIYERGWRGSVMVVDDNFIGNRRRIRRILEDEVVPWQTARGHPFQLNTQLSIRVSDEPDLLDAMHRAGFDKVFAGIESPVEASLKFIGAQKNLQNTGTLIEKVRTLQEYGMEVQAGFIMGLDTDPDDIAERMIAFVEEAGIPIAMIGVLGVLRDTPDYKRYKRQGRLVEGVKYAGDSGIFSRQLSYVPLIDPKTVLARHRRIVEAVNAPASFFERCKAHLAHRGRRPIATMRLGRCEIKACFLSLWRQGVTSSYRRAYWSFIAHVLARHPRDIAEAVRLAVQGHHMIMTTRNALLAEERRSSSAATCDDTTDRVRKARDDAPGWIEYPPADGSGRLDGSHRI